LEKAFIRKSSIAGALFPTLIMEEVLDLISKKRFTLPVRIFFQSLMLACLNVLGDGLHGLIGIPFSYGVNQIHMLFVHSRQSFGIMAGMSRSKNTD
jgi:hypothetical protein